MTGRSIVFITTGSEDAWENHDFHDPSARFDSKGEGAGSVPTAERRGGAAESG